MNFVAAMTAFLTLSMTGCSGVKPTPIGIMRPPAISAQAHLGPKLLSLVGSDRRTVEAALGKAATVEDSSTAAHWGASEGLFYYGKSSMPDNFLAGLDFAVSMQCLFGESGCYIAILGPAGSNDSNAKSAFSTLEHEFGLKAGSLKFGKTLLSNKRGLVREVTGMKVKAYATSWEKGASRASTIGEFWFSKAAIDPKYLIEST